MLRCNLCEVKRSEDKIINLKNQKKKFQIPKLESQYWNLNSKMGI
jgi:hypothetical protein